MNTLALAGGLLGLLVFIPLCINVWQRTITQNLATFLLWGLLDGLAAASTYQAGGNYVLPALYAIGSIAVIACILLRSRSISWTWVETFCSVMALVCVAIWMNWDKQHFIVLPLSTAQIVIVLSSTALFIASMPMLKDAIVDPKTSAPLSYLGYTIANGLSTAAGASWAVEERFYASAAVVATTLIFLAGSRKWLAQQKPAHVR